MSPSGNAKNEWGGMGGKWVNSKKKTIKQGGGEKKEKKIKIQTSPKTKRSNSGLKTRGG